MRADDFVTGDSARGAGQSSLVGTETTNAVNTGVLPGSRTSSRAPVSVTLGETLAICAALTAPALTFGI